MAKIIAFTIVKNDADIIESYCRYYCSFCDKVYIVDDYSDDNTREIVELLIREGLPIILERRGDTFSCREGDTADFAIKYLEIMREEDADVLIPFDVDEFLFCLDGSNPRIELENLEENTGYKFFWRGYIYSGEPNDPTRFLPSCFTHYRDPERELYYKTLLTKQLCQERTAVLGPGSHKVLYIDSFQEKLVIEKEHPRMRIAHFPIRTKLQTMTKIINGWQRIQTIMNSGKIGYHWKGIYEKIKRSGGLSPEEIYETSLSYALQTLDDINDLSQIGEYEGAIPMNFLKEPIRLKYTNYEDENILRNILLFYGQLLGAVKNYPNFEC